MWRLHDGDRVLTEAEWDVFGTGLDMLRSQIETDISAQSDYTETGIPAFDRLTAEQKLVLLTEVALALRNADIPTPAHTAANEAAIVAVLDSFRAMLETEVEMNEGRTDLRECLLAAFADAEDRPERLPKATSTKWSEWDELCECISGRLLWDHDFAMGDEFLDLPPDEARAMMRDFGIDPDYYLNTPDEPGEKGLIAARQTLARLFARSVPDDDGLSPSRSDL